MIQLPERVMRALEWLIPLLQRETIPYQISGGLAAKLYGSPREVNDIDIDIPDVSLSHVATLVKPFIVYGPSHFVDERWDLNLMMVKYQGQDIDVCGCDHTRICDARSGTWIDELNDLSCAENVAIGKLNVKVIPRSSLASYKKLLAGDHQKIDIEAVERSMKETDDNHCRKIQA